MWLDVHDIRMPTKTWSIFQTARTLSENAQVNVGSKRMINRIKLFASCAAALALCSCSSFKPYDLYDVERSTRRLIWSSSWTVRDAPSVPIPTGPQLKDIRVVNASEHDAVIRFGPDWELQNVAIPLVTVVWPDRNQDMRLAAGESVYLHVLEPVFFRDGALVIFAHRMPDAEIESSENPRAKEVLGMGLRPYLRSDFRRLTGSEIAGEGVLEVRMGSETAESQQPPAD